MTLNLESFGENPKKKSKTKYKAALGVGSVVSLFGIGSTLAANISLNGGGNVEFGQGVATTAACDEDGFSITPVTSYDNEHTMFRVESVQVTGIDLTPEGSLNNTSDSYAELGITDKNADSSINQTDAKLQYPGQYYDGTDWKRTCDNVVLDFASYTNDAQYAKYTSDAYLDTPPTDTTSPLMWVQNFANDSSDLDSQWGYPTAEMPSFAAIFDVEDVVLNNDSYESNYFNVDGWIRSWAIYIGDSTVLDGASSSFAFRWNYDNDRPNAAAISKITVQSMKLAPENYYASWDVGPGTSQWLNGG
jgi:hypothetical protein